jgi:hypothetical protein
MPIWLRRLTYNHLVSFTTKESEQKNASNTTEGVTKIDFNKLDEAKRLMGENAGYTTRASKK